MSPLLFTLITRDCSARSAANHIIKFADGTTLVGLIQDNVELAYREEVEHLVVWCTENSLDLNVKKDKRGHC